MKFVFLQVLWVTSLVALAEPIATVAIQPLGLVKKEDIARVEAGIRALYTVNIEILPEKPMPKAAYYPPRDRYKAEDILDILALEPQARFNKILALTGRDISVTTDEGKDWGVMGIGQLGGKVCIVSTFRLRFGKPSEAVYYSRLTKVANHELGHTFGVDHCTVAGCLMQDKHGKIATVDSESGKPCAVCAAKLPLVK